MLKLTCCMVQFAKTACQEVCPHGFLSLSPPPHLVAGIKLMCRAYNAGGFKCWARLGSGQLQTIALPGVHYASANSGSCKMLTQ